MKTLMLAVFLLLCTLALSIFSTVESMDANIHGGDVIRILSFFVSSYLAFLSYRRLKSLEDDFLFLWIKTQSKRFKEKKDSMRKELEEN